MAPGPDRTPEAVAALEAEARAWLAEDPDPDTRAELQQLLDTGDADGLSARFATRLQFGTAGLRGELGAGPNRMNRALVRRAAAGFARYLVKFNVKQLIATVAEVCNREPAVVNLEESA